jgi:hypothetical protein
MPWDGSRYRISGPDEARQLGQEHGQQSGGRLIGMRFSSAGRDGPQTRSTPISMDAAKA